MVENREKTSQKIIKQVRKKFGEQVRRKFGEQVRRKFGKSLEKTLEIILINNNISAQEIAKQLSISSRAVEKQIAQLKKYGILKRIGPAKGGHWEIIKR